MLLLTINFLSKKNQRTKEFGELFKNNKLKLFPIYAKIEKKIHRGKLSHAYDMKEIKKNYVYLTKQVPSIGLTV